MNLFSRTLVAAAIAALIASPGLAQEQTQLPSANKRPNIVIILGDDMGTTIGWLRLALSAGLVTVDEARAYIGKSPLPEGELKPIAVTAIPAEEA